MSSEPTSLVEHFGSLKDPRIERKNSHHLIDIVVIAICGIICGADDWVSISEFGRSKESWFRTFLELPNGIPSHEPPTLTKTDPPVLRKADPFYAQCS